jgi:hypothetical protein
MLTLTVSGFPASIRAADAPLPSTAPIIVRLDHPERLSASFLQLFEGSRAPHPAAALTAWTRASREPGRLGKPFEAVVAFFNPDMVSEWRVLDRAELSLALDGATGARRWTVVIPNDDGTAAAVITAMRLTDGADVEPIVAGEVRFSVERLGRPGSPLAVRAPAGLVIASDRDQLAQGLVELNRVAKKGAVNPVSDVSAPVTFAFDPASIAPGPASSLELRRGVALLQGMGSQHIDGQITLVNDRAIAELTTLLDGAVRANARIDRRWLERIPAAGAMAVVSIAIDPTPDFWSWAFTLADRVERADPARAEVSPLRTRLNLLTASTGARPEADLWPHLRGATMCLYSGPDLQGQPTGGLLMLHLDDEPSARKIATDFFPRLARLFGRGNPDDVEPVSRAGLPRRIARVSGRDLAVWFVGLDVLVGWGDRTLLQKLSLVPKPNESVVAASGPLDSPEKGFPQRVALISPALALPASTRIGRDDPLYVVLAANPPMIWRGWNDGARAIDRVEYAGLKERVRQFLERIPLSAPTIP